jgi:hypothetical protein
VEIGFGMSTVRFELMTWDDDMSGSQTNLFEQSNWNNEGGNSTTSFEWERW